jgi:hypothetical protein
MKKYIYRCLMAFDMDASLYSRWRCEKETTCVLHLRKASVSLRDRGTTKGARAEFSFYMNSILISEI